MPNDVVDVFGFALHLAQSGKKHDQAKPLKGFGGASVLEVVEDHMGDTYRTVPSIRSMKIGVRSPFICHGERSAAIHPRILALPPVLMDNEICLDA